MTPDLILAGAGLANALIALAVAEARPGARILMLDRAPSPSDAHTWSFHDPDLRLPWHRRLSPAIRCRWPGQEVRFPDHSRVLRAGYASLDGAGLARLLADTPGVTLRWNAGITALDATGATLGSERIEAPCVIDGRGARSSRHLVTGYQKFVGLEFEMNTPHGVTRPLIMDATVPQQDGYRFVYLLPFSPTRLLIEDTRYSDGATLDEEAIVCAIADYASDKGWTGREVRRERGVLPIALAHDAAALWAEAQGGPAPVGLRAGLFHPVTGYSLPVAAQVADVVAAAGPTTAEVFSAVCAHALDRAGDDRFLRLLNRMLFRGCPPDRRHRVLSRFYRLPEPLIERFYAGKLTRLDRLRIVSGKPPIPIRDALPCLREAPLLKETA
ncbi:lycopene beta-cyclase CrtY [Paracoccus sp. MC1862]|uniref:lycopene beta-cyclase CrtY n=1 Tax=Paracoccus sp. MC1862 TaxID=2760307 RepID=UPI0016036AD0|nr:lycopene beta-cyclase CrtY [Paracoccus sp. MC1862]MBB1498086.1 lycopene beta-cyclase CrtY [Paracoccus sp. MC1862]QQO43477.1 lycopene beta-cyclase CrtY [Paracoccus sp. MC1862]